MKLIIPLKIKLLLSKLCAEFNDQEWTMFGKIENLTDGVFRLVNIKVPFQKNTSANTEVDDTNLAKFIQELIDEGEDPASWRSWIHSHHSMGAFWSGTDTAQMKSFDMGKQGAPYMIHLVVSSKTGKEMMAAISIYHPIKITIESIPIVIEYPSMDMETELLIYKKLIEDRTTKFFNTLDSSWYKQSNYEWDSDSDDFYAKKNFNLINNINSSLDKFSDRTVLLQNNEDVIWNIDYIYEDDNLILLYKTKKVFTNLKYEQVETLGGIKLLYLEYLSKGTIGGVTPSSVVEKNFLSRKEKRQLRINNLKRLDLL